MNVGYPIIFNALVSGFTWFVIFFGVFIIAMVLACKYGNKHKEECACYNRSTQNCAFCITDKIMISLIMITLALMAVIMIQLGDRISKNYIENCKMDSFILQCVEESKQIEK